MSKEDIDRFVADLKGNASLLDEAKGVPGGLAAMADFAKSKGYDVTVDEAKTYISEQANRELNDAELDAVAGGKSSSNTSSTSVTTVSTNVYAVAEAAVTTVEAAEVATTVWAVAEGVIVLT